MNLFSLNSATVNGFAGAFVVAASAAITGACSISVAATRQQSSPAPVSSGAQINANAVAIRNASSFIEGNAFVWPSATNRQRAYSSISGDASISAFVIRKIEGSSFIAGSSDLVVIPASTLGQSEVYGSSEVIAEATRIQPAKANVLSESIAEFTVEPVIQRFVESHFVYSGSTIRVESSVNNVLDTYVDLRCTADIDVTDSDLVYRQAGAIVACESEITTAPTLIQPAIAQPIAISLVIVADPYLNISPGVVINCDADVVANGTRVLTTSATIDSVCQSQARANVLHGSTRLFIDSESSINAQLTLKQFAFSNIVPMVGLVTAQSTRVLKPEVLLLADGTVITANISIQHSASSLLTTESLVSASAIRIALPESVIEIDSDLLGNAIRTVNSGSLMQGESEIDSSAIRVVLSESDLLCTSEIGLSPTLIKQGHANINANVTLSVRSVANIESFDSENRTFKRPAYAENFKRNAQITEFRRAA